MCLEVEEGPHRESYATDPLESLDEVSKLFTKELKLPLWNAFHSVLLSDTVMPELTTILYFPLIPGPASSYSAVYTALKLAQSMSTWTCPTVNKIVISLALGLFESVFSCSKSRRPQE